MKKSISDARKIADVDTAVFRLRRRSLACKIMASDAAARHPPKEAAAASIERAEALLEALEAADLDTVKKRETYIVKAIL